MKNKVTKKQYMQTYKFLLGLGFRPFLIQTEVFVDPDENTTSFGVQASVGESFTKSCKLLRAAGFKTKTLITKADKEVCMTHPDIIGSEVFVEDTYALGVLLNVCQVYPATV
jgi:hypothetical protein